MKFQKKILLIDHEPGVTRLIRRALERAGKYLIREEHDDKLAINAARWFQPDLILVDTIGQTQLDIERDIQRDLGRSSDYAEGVAAFTEKRTPRFTGR